jgi:uncharacterized membrane protein YkvA (DUF1232 family)
MKVVERLRRWAGRLKAELYALYPAYRDPRVPLYARVFAACVVGYALSPIDLIPATRSPSSATSTTSASSPWGWPSQ